jgi:phosphoribosylformimino-5-aminoimidazole carboxamide ribotide isomerase
VQVGGGLASTPEIEEVLEWGASRVVVGIPLAAEHDALRHLAAARGSERLAVALEVKDGRLAPRAGTAPPGLGVREYVAHARRQGIRTLIHTDVTRDGSLGGPDLDGARQHAQDGAEVIVGGGVGTLDDLRRARDAGLAGVIVGRALHETRFTLAQALACLA